jgi:hypothetical protein
MGRLQSSTENRNWDSIEELWKIKEWIKAEQGEVAKAFQRPTAGDILRALEATDAGRAFVAGKIVPYQKVFGFKSMWAHEFSFRPGGRTRPRSSRRSVATWRPTTTTRPSSRRSPTTWRRPRRRP